MTGTIINIAAVLVGGTIGLVFGARLSEHLKNTVIAGMGLFTTAVGMKMFLGGQNELLVLGALIFGALLGEWWRIEDRLQALGAWLEERFAPSNGQGASCKFVKGFLTASLLYCIGPMAILGSIQDGLYGDYNLLAIKSVLDGFASIAFASTLGVGVLFSALILLVYQGGISLMAGALNSLLTDAMIAEMTATGGVLLMGVGVSSLLDIKKIRVGNFLPALMVAPLLVWLVALFG
jgi:uncharacterized membrane protein YqgA involved in biofilm formation